MYVMITDIQKWQQDVNSVAITVVTALPIDTMQCFVAVSCSQLSLR